MTPRARALSGSAVWGTVAVSACVSGLTGAIGVPNAVLAAATGLIGVAWYLLPALTHPEVGLVPSQISRGVHPARAALTIDGSRPDLLPVLARMQVRATFFVPAGLEGPYREAGHEVGLWFGGLPRRGAVGKAWARSGARLLRRRWLVPALEGFPTVGATLRVATVADARRAVGTDILAVGAIAPEVLAAVIEELRSRAVEPTTVTDCLAPPDGAPGA